MPKYALLLCVDEPSSGMYYGSVVAKPYAKEIYEGIIKYKNIAPDDESKNAKEVVVPSLVGLSLSNAIVKLNELGIDFEVDGEGEKVVFQFPSANKTVSNASTIDFFSSSY